MCAFNKNNSTEIRNRSTSLKKTAFLIGPFILVVLLIYVDFGKIIEAFKGVHLPFVIIGFCLSVFVPLLRSVRWNLINRSLGINISFFDSTRIQFVGNAAAILTPARVGVEISKFVFLKKQDYPAFSIAKGILRDRLLDALPLVIIFLLGLPLLGFNVRRNIYLLIALSIIFFLGVVLLMITSGKYDSKLKRISGFFIPKFNGMKSEVTRTIPDDNRKSSIASILITAMISLIVIFVNALLLYCFIKGFQLSIDLIFAAWCVAGVVICNYLPVSVMGLGTRDILLVFLLKIKEIPAEVSIAISSLIFGTVLLQSAIGVLCYYGFIRTGMLELH